MSHYDDIWSEERKRAAKAQDSRTGVEDFAGKLNNVIAFIESINYTGTVTDVSFFIENIKYYARKIKNV